MNAKKIFLPFLSALLIICTVVGCTSPEAGDSTAVSDGEATQEKESEAPQSEAADTTAAQTFLPKEDEYSVLFVGNSYTYCNEMPEVLFKSICTSAGYKVKVDSVTRGGYYLSQFASSSDEYGKKLQDKLTSNKYDFIVLQEQSGNPAYNPNNFFSGARALVRKIKKYSDAEIVFYQTWGYKDGYHLLPTHGGDTEKMEMKNRAAYTAIAKDVGARVALVGTAFLDLYKNSDIELYDTDFSHPSKSGSALAACTIFATIFKYDVRNVSLPTGISRKDSTAIKEAAYVAAFEDHPINKRYQLTVPEQ